MREKFKSLYLVCLDFGDDINYVVARNPSLMKARKFAEKARKEWPGNEIYISMEKIPLDSLIESPQYQSISVEDLCVCGADYGECVGNLSCKCNSLAKCKNVTKKPFSTLRNVSFPCVPKHVLTPTTINVLDIRRGIVEIEIPEWNDRWGVEESFGISPNDLPINVSQKLKPGTVLIGAVNLETKDLNNLVIEDVKIQEIIDDYDDIEDIDDYKDTQDLVEEYEAPGFTEEYSSRTDKDEPHIEEISEIEEAEKEEMA